jgi:hypothetical protein
MEVLERRVVGISLESDPYCSVNNHSVATKQDNKKYPTTR